MDVLLRTVDMVEEVTRHESMIALRMSLWQTDIFIHIESQHVFERYLAGTIGLDEGVVHTNRRRTGRQAQHELVIWCRIELVDALNDVVCSPL
jgi:hypothetical protein